MSIIPNFKDLKRAPSTLASTKLFPARVVDNNDPLKLQRIKFRVRNLHRGVVDADLPWALPVVTNIQGNNQVGSLSIPVVGSSVIIEYIDDYTVVYRGDFNQDTTKIAELVGTNYPHCYGYVDRSGNKFFVNTVSDTVTFTHLSGTQIAISGTGAGTLIGALSLELDAATDLNIKATGSVNISCAAFNVDAATISLKSVGTMLLAAASTSITATTDIIVNAATFVLNAAFNLVPTFGWIVPPTPTPTPPGAIITPPTPAIPRTKPTITGFSGQTNY